MALSELKVGSGGRHLEQAGGRIFFWLGDTAWELIHKLSRAEIELYLDKRASQGFNVVQTVALSEDNGLDTPNYYSRVPLLRGAGGAFDPDSPDLRQDGEYGGYSYWDHVDFVLDAAGMRGIYIALLPTWGDKFYIMQGKGPQIFTPENAQAYGFWLGKRYSQRSNLIWVLGGDRPLERDVDIRVIDAMADGIRQGGARQLMTFHPYGGFHPRNTCTTGIGWILICCNPVMRAAISTTALWCFPTTTAGP